MARSSYSVQQLLTKMRNPDADFRFMALSDLMNECTRGSGGFDGFSLDEMTEKQTIDCVLELVNDVNTEVKNQAVKTLGVLVKRVSDPRMTTIVDKLVQYLTNKEEQVRDLAGLALKTVIGEILPSSKLAPTLCTRLTPQLLLLLESGAPISPDTLIASLDALSDLLLRFDTQFRSNAQIQARSLSVLTPLLSHSRPAVSRRAVSALGSLAGSSSDELFTNFMTTTVLAGLKSPDVERLKVTVSLVSALAKTSPMRLAKRISGVLTAVLNASASEDEELREIGLQTLEQIVLRCPVQTANHLPTIIAAASRAIKYDPNYAGEGDDDEEMDDDVDNGNEEENDEDFADEYSDDDDVSWKIRRAATKLLATLIVTRPELLTEFYKSVAPILISRFSDREESVKIEIWSTYTVLLKQTRTYADSSPAAQNTSDATLKRKRESTTRAEKPVDGPLTLLNAQAPMVGRSIIKDLGSKSVQVRHAGIILLYELVSVLQGGLESHITPLIARIEAALRSSDNSISGTATNLKIEVFSFCALFFSTHHPKTFQSELPRLVTLVENGTKDPFHRIASEAFAAASALVKVLRPLTLVSPGCEINTAAPIKAIYDATMKRLSSSTADQEVKERAIICLGDLLTYAGDQLEPEFSTALPLLSSRLENEVTRASAVKVTAQIAKWSVAKTGALEQWCQHAIPAVAGFLRKNQRALKMESFACIEALLRRSGNTLQPAVADTVILNLQPLISISDLQVLPLAIRNLALVLELAPFIADNDRRAIVSPIVHIIKSPLLQGPAQDALIEVFQALTRSGADPVATIQMLTGVVPTSTDIEAAKGVTGSGLQPYYTAARCIGAVIVAAPVAGASVVAGFAQALTETRTATAMLFFSLLCLGEAGRVVDLASRPEIFAKVCGLFTAPSDDVRNAAAFAAGNIAAGNPTRFLEPIVEQIKKPRDDKRLYLSLQALKEVIVHTPTANFNGFGENLWEPLFDNSEDQGEAARTVAAECLGKLTLSDPAKYLPQLQARLNSGSAKARSTCMAALRFTLTDNSAAFDDHLGGYVVSFLSHIRDSDLAVRAVALSALNSIAHNKPSLARDALPVIMPQLYAETVVDESLVRIVEMGPFKHRVDDGLETRKLAYATMLTLLDTCLSKININECLNRVLAGIQDEDEIKTLCYLMMVRLSHIAPTAVASHLDHAAEPLSKTVSTTLKDDAVKQDVERNDELRRSALRCLAALYKLANPTTTPKFSQLLRDAQANPKFGSDFRELLATERAAANEGGSAELG